MKQINIPRTELGYLINFDDWDESLAESLAAEENLPLTENHWEIIHLLRKYYSEYQLIPPLRIFIKAVAKELGENKGNSIYLHQLFPGGALKQSCKIAGLPKPRHCL